MNFFNDYFHAIDLIALIAVVVLIFAAVSRGQRIWLVVLAIVAVAWAAARYFNLY